MKVALLFWGLMRSLKYTYPLIEKYIFNVLKKYNIEYKIFIHTYKFSGKYTNLRNKEKNIKLDFNEYKILKPDFLIIDNQDEIKKKNKFKKI